MASDATNEQPCPVANNMDSEEFVQALAEMEKEVANEHYSMKLYKAALAGYDRAIELWPTCARYYANRAACYMMLGQYRNALSDAKRCIEIDPKLLRAYTRVIKCCLILGDIIEAEFTLNKLLEIDPENKSVAAEKKDLEYVQKYIAEAEAAYAAKDYRKVVYCMDRCCSVSTHCTRFKLSKAECLAFLGRYPEALEIANSNLHIDKQNADALYVRGMCLYYQDNVEDAFAHVQQVLRLAPDHTKALEIYKRAKNLMKKKQEGNAAFKMEEYQKAHRLYTEALAIDPHNFVINAKLHCNKAMAAAKLGNWDESVQECTEALKLDENYLKALLRRAASYIELKQYEEAVRDLEKAYKMNKSRDLKRQLFEAKLALKKSKRKDYYKILGIDQNASTDDIKKAYRKRAMVHHPDRHANATEGEKKEQEKKFKEVGEAYGVLSDPKKRLRYDNEHDIDDGETDNGFQDAASFFFDQQQNVVFHPDGGHTFYFF